MVRNPRFFGGNFVKSFTIETEKIEIISSYPDITLDSFFSIAICKTIGWSVKICNFRDTHAVKNAIINWKTCEQLYAILL